MFKGRFHDLKIYSLFTDYVVESKESRTHIKLWKVARFCPDTLCVQDFPLGKFVK